MLNSWFIARRSFASGIASVGQTAGLVVLPMIGSLAMLSGGWPAGWLAIGATVLIVGFVPAFLLMVRAPEDVGLHPDGGHLIAGRDTPVSRPEPVFTRAQAVRTRSFWLLTLFTMLAYPVQAGVSLHQAPFLIERGLSTASLFFFVGDSSAVHNLGQRPLIDPITATLAAQLAGIAAPINGELSWKHVAELVERSGGKVLVAAGPELDDASWQIACHVNSIPRPGDYETFDLGRESVFVLRDKDGSVKAFHNVCRHRGARLLDGAGTCAATITCPYHGWSYRHDGGLVGVPMRESFPGLARAAHGLRPVRVDTALGFVFVCLAGDPPPSARTCWPA